MDSDRYLDFVSHDDVRVQGTRVGIEHLLTEYLAGRSPDELALEFPSVSLEQVHGVLAWYLRNRAEVDDYLRRWRYRARMRGKGRPRRKPRRSFSGCAVSQSSKCRNDPVPVPCR